MAAVHATVLTGPVPGLVCGLLFALLFSPHAQGPGSGLVWGLGHALLLWMAVVTAIPHLAAFR